MSTPASRLIPAARAEGLLPPEASPEAALEGGTSWVVTAASFAGAQLAVWPFVAFLALLLERWLRTRTGLLLVGAALLLGAVALLRRQRAPFVQQLGFGLLLSGLIFLVLGWQPRLDNTTLAGLLAMLLALALAIRTDWVQRALGLLAAGPFLLLVLWPMRAGGSSSSWWRLVQRAGDFPDLANLFLLALAWSLWCLREPAWSHRRLAGRVAALADGLGVAVLLACAWTGINPLALIFGAAGATAPAAAWSLAALLLAALGLGWLARRWQLATTLADPASRLLALAAAALLAASWFVPRVGVVVLVGAVAAGTGRRRTLVLALVVLLAQLAGFYHTLAWPLLHKAALLAAIGAPLAGVLWALRERPAQAAPRARATPAVAALTLAGLLLALGLVQWDVQRKEAVIAGGQRVYVALAPVDPRSILQGDYMALNFRLPPQVRDQLAGRARARGLRVLARLDAQGVASVERLAAPGEEAGPQQVLLPLRHLRHGWTLVTDAYHFPEGAEPRLRQARYGEFRVLPGGQALLVGLADAELRFIDPAATP